MKTICITGASRFDLKIVSDIFGQAGMKAAKPARRDEPLGIQLWHEKVLAAAGDESELVAQIDNPGRLWEQLASEIFVANFDSTLWGWADLHSVPMLDFWLNFEPRISFVLVTTSPERMLAAEMAGASEPTAVGSILDAWQFRHEQVLRFHHRNPQRSVLVDARDCAENPERLIEHCRSSWKLPFTKTSGFSPATAGGGALGLFLAQQLCREYPQTAGLRQELAATVTRFDSAEPRSGDVVPSADGIVAEFRAMRVDTAARQELAITKEEVAAQALKIEALESGLRQAEQEKAAIGADRKQLQVRVEADQKKLAEAREENQLLLSQLHLVQEELERQVVKLQEFDTSKASHDKLQQEFKACVQARDEQTRLANERQNQIAQLTKARDEAVKLATERQQQLDTLKQGKAGLEQERSALTARRDELQKEIDNLKAARDKQLKAAEQENELMLLQLHQVQEELENYFLKHQELGQQLKAADARWQRMLQRNPGYCDYESIEVLGFDAAANNATSWRIKGLDAAGRSLPVLDFRTVIESGVAVLTLTRQSGTTGPLVRWLADAAKPDELCLIRVGTREHVDRSIEVLRNLGTSDWQLLQALNRLLLKALDKPLAFKAPDKFQAEAMRSGIGRFAQILDKFPAVLRFDRASVKREQVNPDYEHLWLRFENVAFGDKRWPEFEFRLSCANVRPQHFGSHPKLEFPEHQGQGPFDSWFIESYDDFGAKLELRFALPESLDLAVWQRLSDKDRSFVAALIDRLPAILATLKDAGVELRRSWDDWTTLAKAIGAIVSAQVVPQAAVAEAAATPPVAAPAAGAGEVPVAKVAAAPAAKPARATRASRAK